MFDRRAAGWLDTAVVAAGALAVYLLLAQEAFHGLDVHVHVFFLTQGHLEHPFHLLYMKLAGAAWPPLRALGLSPHHALRLLSAVGTALGVASTHRAAASVCASRGLAFWVAALTAVLPAVVFFATVAEIHGVFAAFAGTAWWAWAIFVRRPAWWAGAVMGIATGLAASVHATGHLLVPMFLALAWTRGGIAPDVAGDGPPRASSPPRTPWRAFVVAVAAHAVVTVSLAAWLQPQRLSMPFEGQIAFLGETAAAHRTPWLGTLWRVARDEWLLALCPVSLLAWGAFFRRGRAGPTLAVAAAVAAYVGVACLLLDDVNERGAYLLPLAFPLALLTSWFVPRPFLLAAAAAVGLSVAYAQVRSHDHVGEAAWVQGFLSVARAQPVAVICRDVDEQEALTRALPDLPFVRVDSLLASGEQQDGYERFCAGFDAIVAQYRKAGRVVLITRPAYEALLAIGNPFFVRFLREHVPQHYAVDEIARDGFAALRLR
ncbi:MAG: hypothetical protein R3F56_12655 [Planctomycetota bacterium]